MKITVLKIALSALALATNIGAAYAEGETFPRDSDGARLEDDIKELTENCFGKYAKYGPNFLPPDFTSQFGLRPVLERKRDSDRLIEGVQFDLIARSILDTDSPIVPQLLNAAGRSLPIDIKLPSTSPISEANNTIYGLTCSTQMKLALDQGFEFSWWMLGNASAGIKKALDFQSKSEARNSILLMNGTFFSPLYLALASKDTELNARAHSAVFGYLVSPERKANPARSLGYLKSIRGWLSTVGSIRDASTLVNASANGSASLFGLEAKLSSSARVDYSAKFSSTKFAIILERPLDATNDVAPLPGYEQIQSSIAAAAEFFPKTEITYARNGRIPLKVSIRGVPDWLCLNQWEASSADADSVDKVTTEINTSTGACVMSTNATVTKDLAKLLIEFRNNVRPTVDLRGQPAYIKVSQLFSTRLLADPRAVRTGEPIVAINRNSTSPSYSIDVPFTIFPFETTTQASVGEKPKLECDGFAGKASLYPNQIALAGTASQYRLNITVTFDPGSVPTGRCELLADISFTNNAAGTPASFTKQLTVVPLIFPSGQ